MEAPAVQLYKLFRYDLNLSDGKSLELMNLLNKEYKSGIKEDIAALDEKVDARFQQFGSNVDARFEQFGKNVDARFEQFGRNVDARFEQMDKKMDAGFDNVDARFEKVDARFDKIDARFEKVDVRFQAIEERLHVHDKRFDALDSKIDVKTAELHGAIHKSTVDISRYILALAITLIGLFIAMWVKK